MSRRPWRAGLAVWVMTAPLALAWAEPGGSDRGFSIDDVALSAAVAPSPVTTVRVRIELLAEESRTALNGQSADLLLDADCDRRRTRLRKVTVYRAPHQAGSGALASAPPDWLPFSAHSYAAQIAEGICARRGELAAAAAPTGDAAAASLRPPPQPSPPDPGAAPRTAAPAEPSAHAPLSPAAPIAAPIAASVAAPVAARHPATAASQSGGVLIQYLSSTVQADIDQAAARIRDRLGGDLAGLTLATQTVTLRGHTHYRGRVGPFASVSEAQAFCVKVRRLGLACLPLATGPAHGS